MYSEKYYENRIRKLKDRLSELDKQQESYEAERNDLLNYIEELEYNLSMVKAESWIQEAKEGKHKNVLYAELPDYVRQDIYVCIDKYKQGCKGEDAECKKCGQMCIAKGYEDFKKKYNIETIHF